MSAVASLTIGGSVTGLPTGAKTFSGTISSAAAVGQTTEVTLASGDNTITVPTGATAALIQPPSANAVALKLKGAAGDTGIAIHKTMPSILALDASQTDFILNAVAQTAGATEISFL